MGEKVRLTPKQAAERAGISPQLIYLWCAERRLPHLRAGGRGRRGRILIDPDDLDAFLVTLMVEVEGPPLQSSSPSRPASSDPPAGPFSELDPNRLARAWTRTD